MKCEFENCNNAPDAVAQVHELCFCLVHLGLKCAGCGDQAAFSCHICREPLCGECDDGHYCESDEDD